MAGTLEAALPCQVNIKRAEMTAFLRFLQEVFPPATFATDHVAIPNGLQKGRKWCCAARRPG